MTEKEVVISDKTANPAPLGLLGFGITTVLLNLHNAGLFPINSMILAMGFAYGGIAQILASVMEYRKGNTFGTVAFGSYGLFWWSLVLLLVIPKLKFIETAGSAAAAADPVAMASYLFMWGLFTLVMFIATLKLKRGIQVIFISLSVLFFLLTAGEITGSALITTIAGYEGIFTGAAAMYVGLAEVINETYGRDVLPT
ncbi:acetate uptake transporter [Methanothermobacter sp.]|uniref:acetate uptake transporter n=1 Tax=Methanothermobacter sp. TaxID=1884223 RepID=UPI00262B18E6|nr:acetate uptake transporter [Methanothermobacter sp.]MDI9617765.1 acetate uptake transporter [Methanothermobacter sp.]